MKKIVLFILSFLFASSAFADAGDIVYPYFWQQSAFGNYSTSSYAFPNTQNAYNFVYSDGLTGSGGSKTMNYGSMLYASGGTVDFISNEARFSAPVNIDYIYIAPTFGVGSNGETSFNVVLQVLAGTGVDTPHIDISSSFTYSDTSASITSPRSFPINSTSIKTIKNNDFSTNTYTTYQVIYRLYKYPNTNITSFSAGLDEFNVHYTVFGIASSGDLPFTTLNPDGSTSISKSTMFTFIGWFWVVFFVITFVIFFIRFTWFL